MRQPLSEGQIIQLETDKKYRIEKVCGMGASSIVYDARLESGERIRIKEFYPVSLNVSRNEKLELVVDCNYQNQFETARNVFEESYKLQKLLRDNNKLTNSIMPLEGMYSGYGTSFITSVVMEGNDFSQNPAKTLTSLIRTLKSVAKVVNIYHEIGYLHLDIKPANIFRIPETDEHILMFDFDSLIEKESLKKGNKIIISYSRRWAAPEILSSNWSKICEATDVYAIGAIFFYSIFGREVSVSDRLIRAKWDYNEAVDGFLDNVDPKVYITITEFLHKTLACNINRRYSDMNQVIAAFNELEKLSDQEKRYIHPKYRNGIAGFIGRNNVLNQIGNQLKENNIVAVVGMGGIGKTELVTKYTNIEKEHYSKIVCLDYMGTIKNMVCSNDFRINKFDRQVGQTEEDYYSEKIRLLHDLFCPNDLLVIDNYEFGDKNTEDIFSLPCKIILTTRDDLRDKGISCIYLNELDKNESLELFRLYNEKEYGEDDKAAIGNILEKFNYHTLTTELISKYLQYSPVTPSELICKLNDEENIEALDNIEVSSQKDGSFSSKSISAHIKKLYSISNISNQQKEIMLGLSLLENIKISRRLFGILFDWSGNNNDLNELINKSWVKYDRQEDKIYLHPLIQQIVILEKPNTKNCKSFLEAILKEYDKTKTYYEDVIWRKLLESVFKQISGEDYLYAAFCKREGSKQSLEIAQTIFAYNEPKDHLEVSLNLFKKDLTELLDDDMDIYEWEAEEDADRKVEQRVCRLLDRCNAEISNLLIFVQANSLNSLQVEYLINVVKCFCDELSSSLTYSMAIEPREDLCEELSTFPRNVFDYICSLEKNDKLEKDVAITALLKLEGLFNPDVGGIFSYGFASDYLYDEKISNWIKKELRKYREEDPKIGLNLSMGDANSDTIFYSYSDGDELTVDNNTGEKEWADSWYGEDETVDNPFRLFMNDDGNDNTFLVDKYQRKEVCLLMQENGADETWYDYFCALIDSEGRPSEEADLIWMKAYREYNSNLRFICSNAKEIAMECLEMVSKDYFKQDWSYVHDYCSIAIELNRMDDCRNCYANATIYLLLDSSLKNRDKFFELCHIGRYAQDSGHLEEGIRCMAFAVICLVDKENLIMAKETSIWDIDDAEVTDLVRGALASKVDSDIINDLNWMFEMYTLLLRENTGIYDLIKRFLIRENFKDIDFIIK